MCLWFVFFFRNVLSVRKKVLQLVVWYPAANVVITFLVEEREGAFSNSGKISRKCRFNLCTCQNKNFKTDIINYAQIPVKMYLPGMGIWPRGKTRVAVLCPRCAWVFVGGLGWLDRSPVSSLSWRLFWLKSRARNWARQEWRDRLLESEDRSSKREQSCVAAAGRPWRSNRKRLSLARQDRMCESWSKSSCWEAYVRSSTTWSFATVIRSSPMTLRLLPSNNKAWSHEIGGRRDS